MISSITVNYSGKDFFGQYESRSDTYHVSEWDGAEKVGKIIDKVMRKVSEGGYYVHFTHEDGSNDCVYRNGDEPFNGIVTLRHSGAWNSENAPEQVSAGDFKRKMKAELE